MFTLIEMKLLFFLIFNSEIYFDVGLLVVAHKLINGTFRF